MRLTLSRKTFTLEDVPSSVVLSDLPVMPGVSWRPRTGTLRGPSAAAARLQEELARRGVRLSDDEVRAAAAEVLAESLDHGAEAIARFGDARAIPELSGALDAYAPGTECVICDYVAVAALAQAIEVLGGRIAPAQRAKVDALRARQAGVWIAGPDADPDDDRPVDPALFDWARPRPSERVAASRRTPRLGRNDPCHCGSGAKYKRCHLEEDRRLAASTRSRH